MSEVTDSLAKGLQKRLRRECESRICRAQSDVQTPSKKSRRVWEREIFSNLKRAWGPFISPIVPIRDKLFGFYLMEPKIENLWILGMSLINSKKFEIADSLSLYISNHAVERYLQRSCDIESARNLDERAIAEMFNEFRFISDVVNLVNKEKYQDLIERTLHTAAGAFFLTRRNKGRNDQWLIKSYITPEMMRDPQADSWHSSCGVLVDDLREFQKEKQSINLSKRRQIGGLNWGKTFNQSTQQVSEISDLEAEGRINRFISDLRYAQY